MTRWIRTFIPLLAAAALLLPGCASLPEFCGASETARTDIANAAPEDYPAAAGRHVDALRDAAADLDGEQGELANRIADSLERASQQEPDSIEFTEAYNEFVVDSNEFDQTYCVEQTAD